MAFDNCTELERWQELVDFAAELNRDGDRIHFTFFVSGSNFIADSRRSIYEGPHHRRGYSRISFGGSPEQIRRRVEYVTALYRSGHEIASHGVETFQRRRMDRRRLGEGVSRVRRRLEERRAKQRPPGLAARVRRHGRDRFSRALSRQGGGTIRRAQGARL